MQKSTKVIQRGIQQARFIYGGLNERVLTNLPSRRILPITVRNFATSRASQETSNSISCLLKNPRFRVFSKSTAFSFGTLLCAGFWGYASNPKDSKDMKELKAKMEAIRKNYPSIRNFPVGISILKIS